jgi:hypothetical protein
VSEVVITAAMDAAAEAFLAEAFWGHRDDEYRAVLPVVGPHTRRQRGTGTIRRKGRPRRIKQVMVPPYIVAWPAERFHLVGYDPEPIPDTLFVMLCDGDGYRATEDGTGQKEQGSEDWIYVDSPTVPPEWEEPIAQALATIRTIWPGKRLVFRDKEAEPAKEAA